MKDFLPKRFQTNHLYRPILDDSLVLWLKGTVSGSGKLLDISSKGNHGTITGASWANTPLNHPCLSFDGVDDYVNAGNSSIFNLTNNFTIEAWVYWNVQQNTFIRIISKPHSSWVEPYVKYTMGIWSDNKLFFEAAAGGSRTQDFGSVQNAGVWFHMVAVYPVAVYINGVKSFNITNRGNLDTVSSNLIIGRSQDSNGTSLNGLIDDVRIYNRALSVSEISQIYDNTKHSYGKS